MALSVQFNRFVYDAFVTDRSGVDVKAQAAVGAVQLTGSPSLLNRGRYAKLMQRCSDGVEVDRGAEEASRGQGSIAVPRAVPREPHVHFRKLSPSSSSKGDAPIHTWKV
jgi:hypothetical protein